MDPELGRERDARPGFAEAAPEEHERGRASDEVIKLTLDVGIGIVHPQLVVEPDRKGFSTRRYELGHVRVVADHRHRRQGDARERAAVAELELVMVDVEVHGGRPALAAEAHIIPDADRPQVDREPRAGRVESDRRLQHELRAVLEVVLVGRNEDLGVEGDDPVFRHGEGDAFARVKQERRPKIRRIQLDERLARGT